MSLFIGIMDGAIEDGCYKKWLSYGIIVLVCTCPDELFSPAVVAQG